MFSELTEDIVKCCSACFNRIARKLGSVAVTTEPENPVPDEGPGEQPDQGDGEYQGEGSFALTTEPENLSLMRALENSQTRGRVSIRGRGHLP